MKQKITKEVLSCLIKWKKDKVPAKTILDQVTKLGYNLSMYKINKIVNECNNSLWNRSGIYLLVKDDKIMYVGQSTNLGIGLDAHHYGFGLDVLCIEVSPNQLTLVENRLVRKYNPPFNGKFNKKFKMVTAENLDTIVTSCKEKCA